MDWRNHQLRRKELLTMDEKKSEFDLLIQRTKQRIAVGEKLERSIRLLEGTPNYSKKVSGWRDLARNAYDTGKSLFFRKKL